MFSPMSVSLFVSRLLKTTDQMFMKFFNVTVGHNPGTNSIDFGRNRDLDPDPGIFEGIFTIAVLALTGKGSSSWTRQQPENTQASGDFGLNKLKAALVEICAPRVLLVCSFVSRMTQKLLNRFSQTSAERWHGKKPSDFGGNPGSRYVMVPVRVMVTVTWWHRRTVRGRFSVTRRLFNSNNFVTSADLAEVCALLSAILTV